MAGNNTLLQPNWFEPGRDEIPVCNESGEQSAVPFSDERGDSRIIRDAMETYEVLMSVPLDDVTAKRVLSALSGAALASLRKLGDLQVKACTPMAGVCKPVVPLRVPPTVAERRAQGYSY